MDTVTPGVSKDYKDSDQNEIQEQKDKLMAEILELQNTLHDLSQRVHAVKEENEQLQLDSQVLDQYIQGLLENSDIFQSTK